VHDPRGARHSAKAALGLIPHEHHPQACSPLEHHPQVCNSCSSTTPHSSWFPVHPTHTWLTHSNPCAANHLVHGPPVHPTPTVSCVRPCTRTFDPTRPCSAPGLPPHHPVRGTLCPAHRLRLQLWLVCLPGLGPCSIRAGCPTRSAPCWAERSNRGCLPPWNYAYTPAPAARANSSHLAHAQPPEHAWRWTCVQMCYPILKSLAPSILARCSLLGLSGPRASIVAGSAEQLTADSTLFSVSCSG